MAKKGSTFVAFRLDEWQALALSALAAEDMRSRNSLMRAIISDYIRSRMSTVQQSAFKQETGETVEEEKDVHPVEG